MTTKPIQCLIAGGGPAGMMLGYLLARAGVNVTVLEKHKDFLRDFRGDTIHPSTLEVLGELGLLDDFLKRPHQEVPYAEAEIGDTHVRLADFTHLPVRCKYIAFMPQWDFLNFLAEKACTLPTFTLMTETEAQNLRRHDGKVVGLTVHTRSGAHDLHASLVVAADGRHSVLRADAGLTSRSLGSPMDVLWFRLDFREGERNAVLGRIENGQALVMLYRGSFWQCALIIRKGGFDEVKRKGLDAFRAGIVKLARRARADEIKSWDDVKLLTVVVDRLDRWALPGLQIIGDAAHAMSPIGGVGINLAIQDAIAAANILAGPLKKGTPSLAELEHVQRRRQFPTWATQSLQVAIQNGIIGPVLEGGDAPHVPFVVKLAQRWPILQRIPARAIGMGFRPEHVRLKF